jgi:hypothetical protein
VRCFLLVENLPSILKREEELAAERKRQRLQNDRNGAREVGATAPAIPEDRDWRFSLLFGVSTTRRFRKRAYEPSVSVVFHRDAIEVCFWV